MPPGRALHAEDAKVRADQQRYGQNQGFRPAQPRSFHEQHQRQAEPLSTYGFPAPPGGYIDKTGRRVDAEGWVLDSLGRRHSRASDGPRP